MEGSGWVRLAGRYVCRQVGKVGKDCEKVGREVSMSNICQ